MSTVFKKFSKSDVSITPFTAHKKFSFLTTSSLKNVGGSIIEAYYPSSSYRSGFGFEWANSGSDDPSNYKKYSQLDHLFYKNSKLDYNTKFSKIKYFGHSRNLFNRVTVSDVRFDPPVGPEILQSTPEGKFQTQIRITFELYETLTP